MKKIFQLTIALMTICLAGMAQDTTYKELVGKYKFPAGTIVEEAIVTIDNGVLNMTSSQGVSVLEKMKGDTFNIVSFNGIAVFKRNEAKKISGVHIDASGYILDGEKAPLSNLNGGLAAEQILIAENDVKEKQLNILREAIASKSISTKNRILGCVIP